MAISHIHNSSMEQYAQDALVSPTPWEQWEYSHVEDGDDGWTACTQTPTWLATLRFRRTTPTVRVNELEFAARFFAPPCIGSKYWFLTTETEKLYDSAVWNGDETDLCRLNKGFVFPCEQTACTAACAIFGLLARDSENTDPHCHAQLMDAYAQTAKQTSMPWAHWEYKTPEGDWQSCSSEIEWDPGMEYRQALPTVDTTQQDPEILPQEDAEPQPEVTFNPLVTAPEVDSVIWVITTDDPDFVRESVWSGSTSNLTLLERAMLFANRDDALKKASVLFTTK